MRKGAGCLSAKAYLLQFFCIFVPVTIFLDYSGFTVAINPADDDDEFFPFTECDHVFDSTDPHGRFSFPMIPSITGGYGVLHSLLRNKNEHDINVTTLRHDESDALFHDEKLELENSKNRASIFNQKYFFDGEIRHIDTNQILPSNIQCIYTFVAGKEQRVKLEFTEFQLAGTADNCDLEYVDIYSELHSPSDNLLTAALGGRYCGTVAPHVRISLHNVLILVFHSRIGNRRSENIRLKGKYSFISESRFLPGQRISDKCSFQIERKNNRKGTILSPTYPGTYPSNFRCLYLLKGKPEDRIRLYFTDFDIYFGGEHCPYDSLTVYDGPTNAHPILRKICGLQQRLEIFSFASSLLLEFNTTDVAKNDPRGFVIDYEFSDRFVDLRALIHNQRGVSHVLGTECDIRILSNRESVHEIASPNFPNAYPLNTTCTYILDGLQGDQNLEKVILSFDVLSLDDFTLNNNHRNNDDIRLTTKETSNLTAVSDDCTSGSFVGVALTTESIKTILSMTEESVYDVILCNNILNSSTDLGPYTSFGPRIVVVFGSADASAKREDARKAASIVKAKTPHGFRARVEFKTDFGVPGEAMGDSNKCMFRFTEKRGSFNSPRYPANYPLDTNCTYIISGKPGEEILLYFTQFALFEENSKNQCNDYLEIYDVFNEASGNKRYQFQAKHCWTMFPGPTVSTFGAQEMRVVFSSDSFGTANGFNALYEIRPSRKEDVPNNQGNDVGHCGHLIEATQETTTGYFTSPGFPVKYNKDQFCDWEIRAREGHQILLQLTKMDVEGEITNQKTSCMNAVIVIHMNFRNRSEDMAICGTNPGVLAPIVTTKKSIRISFLTAPEKVNGLTGFNFTWTEVRMVQSDAECADEMHYLCSYTRLCIAVSLRCNGDENCGENDDTDEAHCNIAEKVSDMRTILVAATFSGFIFLFIFGFFCFLFKKKLERKKQRNTRNKRAAARILASASTNTGKLIKSGSDNDAKLSKCGSKFNAPRMRSGTYLKRSHHAARQPNAQQNGLNVIKKISLDKRFKINDESSESDTSTTSNAEHIQTRQPYRCTKTISPTRQTFNAFGSGHPSYALNPIIMIRPDSETILTRGFPTSDVDETLPIASVNPEFVSNNYVAHSVNFDAPMNSEDMKIERVFFG